MGEYRLDLLGWYQFERLCQTLLSVTFGLDVETWGGQRDWGRDAWAEGPLRFPSPQRERKGPYLFQCKFVEDAAAIGPRRATTRVKALLRHEAKRIEDRLAAGWRSPRHYVVMTNARLTGPGKDDCVAIVSRVLPGTRVHLVDERQLEPMITAAPGVRLSFPQILSLRDLSGVLERVVNRDLRNRADALLADAADLATVFMPTRAYHRAVDLLNQHGFVVLTGPPETGKTSIARIIALARAADGWDVIDCRTPEDLERMFERERPQVFVADDAFGSTEYRPDLAEEWAARLPSILRRVDRCHWLAWTSRSAPLRAGLTRLHLQGAAERFPDPSKVLVDAARLTRDEKALMLYRHCKASELDAGAREIIRDHADLIVDDRYFTPLRMSRFVRSRLQALADVHAGRAQVQAAVVEELAQATGAMARSFAALSEEQKALLIAMLDTDSRGFVPLDEVEQAFVQHHGNGAESFERLVQGLEEHFLDVR